MHVDAPTQNSSLSSEDPMWRQMSLTSWPFRFAFARAALKFLASKALSLASGNEAPSRISVKLNRCGDWPRQENAFFHFFSSALISSWVNVPCDAEIPNTRLRRCGRRNLWVSTLLKQKECPIDAKSFTTVFIKGGCCCPRSSLMPQNWVCRAYPGTAVRTSG